MVRLYIIILMMLFFVLGCGGGTITPTAFSPTTIPTITPIVPTLIAENTYYVATNGNDANPGTLALPWLTIQKAVNTLMAGDTVYVRGGQYDGIKNGWHFKNSGTQSQPITLTNYPGEQVVFKIITAIYKDREIFYCLPKTNYIHIIGTDVIPRLLSNGVESKKGIVIQGMEAEQSWGIVGDDCDYWEIAGVDFIETATGIRTYKFSNQTMVERSTDYWYVHDNRVYNYYRESGMQFNGDNNLIENNEIYKVSSRVDAPYGCQHLNVLGDNNIVRGNTISRLGSTSNCSGILLEWDLADENLIERNLVYDVPSGIDIEGGDNNVIRNNVIYRLGKPEPFEAAMEIRSHDDSIKAWPCNETSIYGLPLLPPNNPAHPDYKYYYNPRNCHSYGNQIYNNTVHGFEQSIRLYPLLGENTIIRNNIFSGWTRGGICFYQDSNGICKPLTVEVTADHNAAQGPFGFVDIQLFDFHLTANSPLIDAGFYLGSQNPNDFDNNPRLQGLGYDIGAYEYWFFYSH